MDNTIGIEIARLLEASAKISTALLQLSEDYSAIMNEESAYSVPSEGLPIPLKVLSHD